MSDLFYKVVRPDLSSFHDESFVYRIGGTHRPRTSPTDRYDVCSDLVLHASREPAQAARYGRWPYRLLEVTGRPVVEERDKAGFRQLHVVREAPVAEVFGPNGSVVVALIDEFDTFGVAAWAAARAAARAAAGDAARDAARAAAGVAAWAAARDAARDAARAAARDAARAAAGDAAWAAARALVVADLVGQHGLEQHHIDTLMAPIEAARKVKADV